jgi:hypothetical protein
MRKVSKKRAVELKEYSDIKKKILSDGSLRCVFSGLPINSDFDIHHINGERENEHLVDEQYLFPCLREYHTLYHNSTFKELIELEWYRGYLEFLKRYESSLWEKELYKPVKSGDKSLEWYGNVVSLL